MPSKKKKGSAEATEGKVLAALRGLPNSTVQDLAASTRLSRATVHRTLTRLVASGLAQRETTEGRKPDRWSACPLGDGADQDTEASNEPDDHESAPTSDSAQVTRSGGDDASTPERPDAPAAATSDDSKEPEPDASRSVTSTPAAQGNTALASVRANRSGTERLRKGALHGMVKDLLDQDPSRSWKITEISNYLNRSGGAIGNALDRLTESGDARLVREQPRTFQSGTGDLPNHGEDSNSEDSAGPA